ncbi:hypothetical protein [Bradyrhizobium sp. U531]|uniref:hypothetical protein n=1 Tax=Bradyrhizobium sp. U531 TaxID=3053458 RepID=UPI003F685A78
MENDNPHRVAPTRLHRRCLSTGSARANYRYFGLSGHILREMVLFVARGNTIKLVRIQICFHVFLDFYDP